MVRRYGALVAIVGGVLVAAWSIHASATRADDDKKAAQKDEDAEKKATPKKIAMKMFMRKKLESSQSVLEGLAVEDFELIAKGARQLKTTSAAAEFMVVHDPMYAQHADEFRRIVDKMEKAAKEKRLDGATLAYVDMTLSCVECHKYVRNVLIARQ
ncbi:MAG: hypothetical protein HY290_13340 [Planctomycetia bacterium]|nr:hypothetical protein [Planctomycetia bacterium]